MVFGRHASAFPLHTMFPVGALSNNDVLVDLDFSGEYEWHFWDVISFAPNAWRYRRRKSVAVRPCAFTATAAPD